MVSDRDIERAAGILKAGGLVAFPTETVYGLGADASSADAVRKIFAAKNRPADHPVIVHVADASQLADWVITVPESAKKLGRALWPGPLTIILQRAAGVPDVVTGGQDTVAVRVPSHPVAQRLLRAFGGGIAAPSANRFGRISATTAAHVRKELGDAVDIVLDGGAADVGIESTIVDLSGTQPALLRPGAITRERLETVLDAAVLTVSHNAPRAPGTLAGHYAPQTPLVLIEAEDFERQVARLLEQQKQVAALARRIHRPADADVVWIAAPRDAEHYAHELYATVRTLDEAGCDVILVEAPPPAAEWTAVRDRLTRAATGSLAPENG
ncbi:MAG TPA: L-threonylcarbamoyladenylate synthase [Burkholderiales bacterium]|jgi:L-threonylcarbamoyladenylate synthase|nr:L-threonylcarbamoyladenylate synthase [Burkholderiales bacterium]